jgi:hypothetical protein
VLKKKTFIFTRWGADMLPKDKYLEFHSKKGVTNKEKGVTSALDSRCSCYSMSWCAEMSQEQIGPFFQSVITEKGWPGYLKDRALAETSSVHISTDPPCRDPANQPGHSKEYELAEWQPSGRNSQGVGSLFWHSGANLW